MSARKRKAVPARLSPDHLRPGSQSGVGCGPEVNGYSDQAGGSGNGEERAMAPEVGLCHVSGDVMESIRSVIGAAPTMEDKQRRLNAMIHQLQVIRNQLTRQRLQQVRVFTVLVLDRCHTQCQSHSGTSSSISYSPISSPVTSFSSESPLCSSITPINP